MVWPRLVAAPREEPVGKTNPDGKGLLRVVAGVSYLLVVVTKEVTELNPS